MQNKHLYIDENGNSYEGEFKDGKMHGNGVYRYANDDEYKSYTGQFYRGKKHGAGRLEFTNGDVFEGGFEIGEPKGLGRLILKDGSEQRGWYEELMEENASLASAQSLPLEKTIETIDSEEDNNSPSVVLVKTPETNLSKSLSRPKTAKCYGYSRQKLSARPKTAVDSHIRRIVEGKKKNSEKQVGHRKG
jgi:hypothetical protein